MIKEKQERLRKNKGITLVALVVTIVILLILAGISITLILDNNGIINKSGEAADKYGEAQTNEQTSLNSAVEWIDNISGGSGGGKTVTLAEAKDNSMLSQTENSKLTIGDDTVWIPAGYKVAEDSADTVDYGIVITDAEANGNEWVWVPVDSSTLSKMYEENTSGISLSGSTGVKTTKYSASEIISGITRGLPNSTSYREPGVVPESIGSGGRPN